MRICSMFAEFPQALFIFVCYLRNFRKYCSFLCFACGTSAKAMQFAFKFIPSYSGVFLMGVNGFSGGDSCGGKGKMQCRLSASLAFSGWFSAVRNLFRALLLRWKCGVELAKSLHAGCRRACYSFLASMACVMSTSNSSQSSGLSCSNVFVASRPCANLESL